MENQVRNNEIEIDLRELFGLFRSRFLLILLAGIIFASAAGAYCVFTKAPVYQSTSKIYMVSDNSSMDIVTRLQQGTVILEDYKIMVTSRPVVNQVDKNLNLKMGYGALAGKVSVNIPEDTRVMSISVSDTNPKLAMKIAQEFAEVSVELIPRIMRVEEPTIFEDAVMPMAPIGPNKTKYIGAGFILGVFLMMLFIVIRHVMDDSIKTKSDVEKYLNTAVLASLPSDKSISKSHKYGRGYGYGYGHGHRHRKVPESEGADDLKFEVDAELKLKSLEKDLNNQMKSERKGK